MILLYKFDKKNQYPTIIFTQVACIKHTACTLEIAVYIVLVCKISVL